MLSFRSFQILFGSLTVAALAFAPPLVFAKEPAKTSVERVRVVIIGAGLSGLGTAYYLKQAGLSDFKILEIAPNIGGRVQTATYQLPGGETVSADSGMEEYWDSNPAVDVIKALKLDAREDVAVSSIVLKNKLYPLLEDTQADFHAKVFTASERAALKDFKARIAPMIKPLKTGTPLLPAMQPLVDVSLGDWIKTQNLPEKVSEWLRVSLECEIGTGWENISAVDGLAELHIFLGEEGEKAHRINGGNARFTAAIADFVGREKIKTGQRVTRLVSSKDRITVSYRDLATNTIHKVEADFAVSTIPLFRLFEMQFEPALSKKKAEAIASMSWGSYFKAHVLVRSEAASKFWAKSGDSTLPILSDSSLGVIYDGNPDQEKAKSKILSLLITGGDAERFNLMPLDLVRSEITVAFDKLWPGLSSYIKDVEFFRYHPRAIAAWPPGRSRFDALSEAVRTPENRVILAGDFTESSHSDGAFISARKASDFILKTSGAFINGR